MITELLEIIKTKNSWGKRELIDLIATLLAKYVK
jgi:hypothetical protein